MTDKQNTVYSLNELIPNQNIVISLPWIGWLMLLLGMIAFVLLAGCGVDMPQANNPALCPVYKFVVDTQQTGFIIHDEIKCSSPKLGSVTYDVYHYNNGVILYYESNSILLRVDNGPACVSQMYTKRVPDPGYSFNECKTCRLTK